MNEEKYKRMEAEFRADGVDENTIMRLIREETEKDEFVMNFGITDVAAYKEWRLFPEETRRILLNNAFCINCMVTSFAPGYAVRKDKFGIVLEGVCSKCGERIARTSY